MKGVIAMEYKIIKTGVYADLEEESFTDQSKGYNLILKDTQEPKANPLLRLACRNKNEAMSIQHHIELDGCWTESL